MDIQSYMHSVGREARKASRATAKADTAAKDQALLAMAAAIDRDPARLLEANLRDVDGARAKGLAPALVDRLALTARNVASMAEGLRQIAQLPDPIGEISDLNYRPSGIQVGKMRVPLGVIGIIYESRPNVTADAAGLCLKSGNAAILRGGSGGHPFQPGHRRLRACRAARRRIAGDCRAGGRNHRPRRGGRAHHHEGIRGRHRAARRQGPDRAHFRTRRASR